MYHLVLQRGGQMCSHSAAKSRLVRLSRREKDRHQQGRSEKTEGVSYSLDGWMDKVEKNDRSELAAILTNKPRVNVLHNRGACCRITRYYIVSDNPTA